MLARALDLVPALRRSRAAAGLMLVGLDFDGTLAPIVARPGDAALPDSTRPLLQELAERADTLVALVSGRSLTDLRSRIGMAQLYYAGNHGLEIEGRGLSRVQPEAAAAAARLSELAAVLDARVGGIPGVIVEDKGLTLSIHYRMVQDEAVVVGLLAEARAVCAGVPGLRLTEGKKVLEVRPDVDWHKGLALRFLRETLLAGNAAAPTLFIGDDRTDEDAFREVGDGGAAIVVGDPPPADTAAHAFLRSTTEVAAFIASLG